MQLLGITVLLLCSDNVTGQNKKGFSAIGANDNIFKRKAVLWEGEDMGNKLIETTSKILSKIRTDNMM